MKCKDERIILEKRLKNLQEVQAELDKEKENQDLVELIKNLPYPIAKAKLFGCRIGHFPGHPATSADLRCEYGCEQEQAQYLPSHEMLLSGFASALILPIREKGVSVFIFSLDLI